MLNENWSEEHEKRRIRELNSLKEIETEIKKAESEIQNFQKSLYWVVPTIILICLVLPYFRGKFGGRPLIESIGYLEGVLFCILIFLGVYIYTFYQFKRKNEDKLFELNSRKRRLENRK
ncbi:hypothetical protein ACOKFD_16290 [Flagellimonas sp. S174]|uniref:hypothetical protein n=1 Tax=Flagellimonas sp. S174 TaxID=3410790 RepID=UPI003BF4EAE2